MIRALLYDEAGYPVGEPDIPSDPCPHALIWGNEVYIVGKAHPANGRPQYFLARSYVIPDTRESVKF